MERSHRQVAGKTPVKASRSDYPLAPAVPTLLTLALAPVVAGYQDPPAALLLCALPWIGLLLRSFDTRLPALSWRPAYWIAALLPVLALLSFFGSANRGATAIQTVLYLSYGALFLLAADMAAHRRTHWLLAALLGGAFLTAGLGVREYLEHLKIGHTDWRTFSRFTNPNFFAGYLVPVLLLTLGVSVRRPEAFKPPMWLLACGLPTATFAAALITTGSRGGLLSLAVGLLVLLVLMAFRFRSEAREAWPRLGLLLLVLIGVSAALSTPVRQRQETTTAFARLQELRPKTTSSAAADSNRFRIYTWRTTWNMGAKRPLLGWGAGTYETAISPHLIAGYTRHAHNSYLQWFAEQGALSALAWLALMGTAAVALLRRLRSEEGYWATPLLAALAASAVHNVFDSLYFVPAIAMAWWALFGMSLAPSTPPVPEAAATGKTSAGNRLPSTDAHRRMVLRVGAALGGVLLLIHASGRLLLESARTGLSPDNAMLRLGTLGNAQLLLPWDLDVALSQSRAHANMGLGSLDQAIREAHRAVRIAPYRLATYQWIGTMYKAQGQPDRALLTYQQGLTHQPQDVNLLYSLAQIQDDLRQRREALETYRRIVAVESTPMAQVRALDEVRDYRYARAHLVLAEHEAAVGNQEAAHRHRLNAACLLAERRYLFEGSPVMYMEGGLLDADLERQLRVEEQESWRQLAEDYRAQGENRAAELAEEELLAVEKSRDTLERIIDELRREGLVR